jgi:sterol desaturase/sphingolipid hydroxylase (fatty acid hydroxylase superfamily)
LPGAGVHARHQSARLDDATAEVPGRHGLEYAATVAGAELAGGSAAAGAVMQRVVATALTFACLWLVYGALERAFPARAARAFREPDFCTDTCFFLGQYLVFSTVAIALLTRVHGVASAAAPLALQQLVLAAPPWLVAALAVLLGDVLVYWFHRACHHFDVLWRFHAVHHSSERLDWLAAHREHPVDGMLTQIAQNLPAMLLGVPFELLAVLVAFRGAWSILIHSNVRFPLGPLRLLFGAPELHHFHHARVERTAHNFANLAPWLDVAFGTYRRPAPDESYSLGLSEAWPKSYLAQLAEPFRARSPERRRSRSEALVALLALVAPLGCGPSTPVAAGPGGPVPEPGAPPGTMPRTAVSRPAQPLLPDTLRECMHEGARDFALSQAPCSAVCTSFRVVPRRCEQGHWRELPPIDPACACAPESVAPSLRECTPRSIVLTPTGDGASDGVDLKLTCGTTLLDVECDGENDGTGTSLCSCHRDGAEVRIPGDPWPGEGISLAYRVAERCLAKEVSGVRERRPSTRPQ